MRFIFRLTRSIAVFSGLGAGFAKLIEMPGEVIVYGHAGLGQEVLYLFGAVQLGAALLMLFARTHAAGGVLLATTFGVSAYLLFQDDKGMHAAMTGTLCVICLIAAFWGGNLRRFRSGSYVRPGSEIWR
jgi:hypothetical protein